MLRKTDESIEYDFKSGVKNGRNWKRETKKSPVIKQTEITIENIPDTISRGNKRKNKNESGLYPLISNQTGYRNMGVAAFLMEFIVY